jgi:predicted Zn-dependent protease
MSSRWFIPASLAIFSGFVAAIWLYLAATQEPAASSPVASRQESPLDRELEGVMNRSVGRGPSREKAPPASPAVHQSALIGPRRRVSISPSLAQTASQVADRLDESSVRLRGDLVNSAILREAQGLSAAAGGDHEAALRHLDRTLARNPRDMVALAAKASSLVALERFQEAANVYQEIVRLSPRDAAARYNYAVVLFRLGRFDETAHELREVVQLVPDHADAQYNLASLAQREGRINEAREAWQALTRLRPQIPSGWFNLGVVNMDFDEPDAATDAFAHFTALSPSDADGWINLALAEAATDHLESALYALNIADELAPCEGLTLDLLAQVHELLAERDPSSANVHFAAVAQIRDLIGKSTKESAEPLETVAASEKN